jgi:opacity protein-like surface antigen
MKKTLMITASVLALTSGAQAADFRGSVKDEPVFSSPAPSANRGGFYIRGDLGIANGERDISRRIDREAGIDLDVTGEKAEDVQDFRDTLSGFNVPSTLDGNTLSIPLIGDRLGLSDRDDFSSSVFGAEALYLWQPGNGRMGFSVGLGATFYGDAESRMSHAGANGKFVGGTALADFQAGGFECSDIGTCAGDPSPFSQTGTLHVERDFDIDLVGRIHYFATDRLALNAGLGVSFARANLSGVNVSDQGANEAFGTRFDEDDTAIGLIATVGADYWLTDRITIGASYDYKHHEFSADASSRASTPLGGPNSPVSIYGKSHDSADVEDDIHTFKAKIGFKID